MPFPLKIGNKIMIPDPNLSKSLSIVINASAYEFILFRAPIGQLLMADRKLYVFDTEQLDLD